MLVDSDYDLDIQNIDGDTATHLAAALGNLQNLQELVEADSDIDTLNNHSFSPLYLALLNKHHDCAEYLIKEGA